MNVYRQIAANVIDNNLEKDCFICTCGIGPTGRIHIGKTFDILCTAFVSNELNKFNKKTKVICFIDDCITDLQMGTIDSSLYIQQLKSELEQLSISVDFIYSSVNYKNNCYEQYFRSVYSNEEVIHEILKKHHTGEYHKKLSAIFNVYCPYCGNLLYDVNSIGDYQFSYACKCGCHGIDNIFNNKTFLRWKIETPIRWYHYNSCFEPAAFNHNDPNGSFIIAKEICLALFKQEPPQTLFYQYFCDEAGNKFSARKNVGCTITELLTVFYPAQIIEYLKSLNINRPIKFSIRKMFNEIYYGKKRETIQKDICLTFKKLSHELVVSIISISKYYFYDSDIICKILDIDNSEEIQDFIKRIKSYHQITQNKSRVVTNSLKTVFGYLIDSNSDTITISEIKKIIRLIRGYSYELFCMEFYGYFFNTESGPPLTKIFDNCHRYLYDKIQNDLHNEYTYMIIYPEGMSQLDSIKKTVLDFGLQISCINSFVFDEKAMSILFGCQNEQNRHHGYGGFIGKQGIVLILFGCESVARLSYIIQYKQEFSHLMYTNVDQENIPLVLGWYFKSFVFENLKEKIINVISTPANKERYEKHIIPVVENVKRISSALSIGDEEYILIIAAFLHDIAKFQLEENGNFCSANHAIAGAEWAKFFLKAYSVCDYYIEIISRCIEKHNLIPTTTNSLDERIIAAADGMAHIDYPWIMICKYIKKQGDLPYDKIYNSLFNDRLYKSLRKITFSEFQAEYREKIDKLKQLLK